MQHGEARFTVRLGVFQLAEKIDLDALCIATKTSLIEEVAER